MFVNLRVLDGSISIHALLAESDFDAAWHKNNGEAFLSTLSLRRATEVSGDTWQRGSNFYPRSPCGERLQCNADCNCRNEFLSTLSLRRATRKIACDRFLAEFLSTLSLRRATSGKRLRMPKKSRFLSTLSLRRATHYKTFLGGLQDISIHALLAESDTVLADSLILRGYFYPRSPCGERRRGTAYGAHYARFLSTLSLRRATRNLV